MAVVVLTLNERQNLVGLAESLGRMHVPDRVELYTVVVDAGSTDGSAEIARELGFDLVLELPGSTIPEARNAGASAVDSEWIAYIDADCRPEVDWLITAAATVRSDPLAVAGWPAGIPSDSNWVQRAWGAHWQAKAAGFEIDADGLVRGDSVDRLLTTRNLVLTRQAFDTLGGFDEALPTGEDSEFTFRAVEAGLAVTGVPALTVRHLGEPSTLGEFFRQQLWHANHRSYSPGANRRHGRNPALFTAAWLIGLAVLLIGVAAAVAAGPWWIAPLSAVPMTATLTIPALRTARRVGNWKLTPALTLLYGLYGLARSVDLAGGARRATSWRIAPTLDR